MSSKISEITRHALREIEEIIKTMQDEKVLTTYYQEFWRRAVVLELVKNILLRVASSLI
jgi:hypothetical protein